jgi:hypothetical protein
LFVTAWVVYARFGLRLAQGAYFDFFNLAFDFDPPLTLGTFTSSAAEPQGFRHPLMSLLRPLAWPFLAAGLMPKEAAVLVIVTFGAGTVGLCLLFLRVAGIERPEAAGLSLLFAVTGTQVFTSVIVETYGIASFTIALIWVVTQLRLEDPNRLQRLRYVTAILAFGVTITNFAQAVIAECLICWRHDRFRKAVRRVFIFGLICAALAIIPVAAVWHDELWAAVHDPVPALKSIYWMRSTKPREAGFWQLVLTFFGFSFVSPQYTLVTLGDGLPLMRDFRNYAFLPSGHVAIVLWLGFWAVGAIAAFCHRRYRWVALGLLGAIVLNVLLHMNFQWRGSVYIYAAHLHFPIFALGAGLAPFLGRSLRKRGTYLAVVLLLAVLIGADNLSLVAQFVTDFDGVTQGG